MKMNTLNRTIVAVGISAVAVFGLGVTVGAQAPSPPDERQQDGQKEKQDKKEQKAKPAQGKSQYPPPGQQKRLTQQEQNARIQQQEQRTVQYRQHLDEQQRVAQQQYSQLQQQNRRAQVTYQQQYVAALQQQQARIQVRHDYAGDPYFYTPSTYRYARGGRYYETNQYGADLLRQAVNSGYDQGIRAGQADRQDRWASNYQSSYAYQDANYGYDGYYVDRADYNAYFREGFRRGYADGYNGRYVSGTYVSGRGTMLGAILATIINFESIVR